MEWIPTQAAVVLLTFKIETRIILLSKRDLIMHVRKDSKHKEFPPVTKCLLPRKAKATIPALVHPLNQPSTQG